MGQEIAQIVSAQVLHKRDMALMPELLGQGAPLAPRSVAQTTINPPPLQSIQLQVPD